MFIRILFIHSFLQKFKKKLQAYKTIEILKETLEK